MLDDAVLVGELPDKERGYTAVGSYKYTEERLNLEFLDNESHSAYAKKAAAMLMSRDGKQVFIRREGERTDLETGEFCPHIRYCSYAIFGIDYKGDSE